jgi:hypothetical protein
VLTVLGAGAHPEEPAAAKPAEKAMSCCQQMMQKQKDGLAALESKATAMNAAQGAEKVDAIAAVVNELVAQHRGMHAEQGCPGGCSAMGEKSEKSERSATWQRSPSRYHPARCDALEAGDAPPRGAHVLRGGSRPEVGPGRRA